METIRLKVLKMLLLSCATRAASGSCSPSAYPYQQLFATILSRLSLAQCIRAGRLAMSPSALKHFERRRAYRVTRWAICKRLAKSSVE